jgi:hypothetical protein
MRFFFLTLTLISLNLSFAQHSELGSFNVLNLKYNYDKKWSVFGEGQIRSLGFYDDFNYYEYKFGINYKAHKNITLTFGSGSYQTFQDEGNFTTPKRNNEFRLWPQVMISQNIGDVIIEQRFRAEQRFTTNGYRNRFRYRLGLSYPFGKNNKDFKLFQIVANNELFFSNIEPYFERNRSLVAFNYKPSKATTLQLGFVHQFDYKINDEIGRNFLLVGYFVELFPKDF